MLWAIELLRRRQSINEQIAKIAIRYVKAWIKGDKTRVHLHTIELFHATKMHPDYKKEMENDQDDK